MTQDVAGFGLKLRIIASSTFPAGFTVTQASDDADFLDSPSIQINDKSMGANGDLITWSKANPLVKTVNVIPRGIDDINLSILFEANRVGKGKQSARDVITMVAMFPDGSTESYLNGVITDGMPGNALASAGRLKTKPYMFAFENKISTL